VIGLVAGAVLLTAPLARAQMFPPITNRDFNIDLFEQPAVGSPRLIGMGDKPSDLNSQPPYTPQDERAQEDAPVDRDDVRRRGEREAGAPAPGGGEHTWVEPGRR